VLLLVLALVVGGIAPAIFIVASFAVFYFYNVLFEVLAQGRTPGKRITHLRVVLQQGTPVDLAASLVRNLLRLIDELLFGLPALISILLSRHNQRLGDLAAGTLVIRDAKAEKLAKLPSTTSSGVAMAASAERAVTVSGTRAVTASAESTIDAASAASTIDAARWDLSAVSPEELAAIRRFLERRHTLNARARRELAYRLEQGLRLKVSGAPPTSDPERFLEALAQSKSSR
jgi:RDD family